MANYYGTAGNDVATISGRYEKAYGYGGNDKLTSTGDTNVLDGDLGNDTLTGSSWDTLYGGDGDDTLSSSGDYNLLVGGFGADRLTVAAYFSELNGGDGNDTLTSTGDSNVLYGDWGNDTLTGSSWDTLYGGDGDDTLSSSGEANILVGGGGADRLTTANRFNNVNGDDGDDTLTSTGDTNELYGDWGNDTLTGSYADTLYGGFGADRLTTADRFSSLNGGNDNDTLISTGDSNTLNGDLGNDTLTGSYADTLTGGAGNDIFTFSNVIAGSNTNPNVITDFVSGEDKIDVSGMPATLWYGGTMADANTLWYVQSGGNTDVLIDTTGDGVADTMIRLIGTLNLTASDFIGLVSNNTAPTANAVSVNGGEDEPSISGNVSATDPENNPLTYRVSGGTPAGVSFNSDGGFSYTPQTVDQTLKAGQSRDVTFEYVANDGTVDSAAATVTITINGANDAPTLSTPAAIVYTDTIADDTFADVTGDLLANDVDGDSLSYGLSGGADNGDGTVSIHHTYGVLTLNTSTGAYRFVANDAAIEPLTSEVSASFTVTVSDGSLSDSKTLSLRIYQQGITESDGNDVIEGTGGDDTLNGGGGADTLIGGAGDDTYIVDDSGDVVIETGDNGTDTVNSYISARLGGNLEKLNLLGTANINGTGNALNNVIRGNSANNVLNGGIGADTLIGGLGNDTFYIDNSADVMVELAGEGLDRVVSTFSYTLGANFEYLTLQGSALFGVGNELANNMTGNALNNVLQGLVGNDVLNGGAGADTLEGGSGNDVYYVDVAGDVVIEAADEGSDTVYSQLSYTLGVNVENLTLQGSALTGNGNELKNSLIGNALDNVLTGWAGNDVLNGGVGVDTLIGGTGDDSYYVDNSGDVVVELSAEGLDSLSSTISWTLGDYLENLTLSGTADSNGVGNGLANKLTGNSGNNVLDGGAGNDVLSAGAGTDMLVGGTGNDNLTGGVGNDVYIERRGDGNDLITDIDATAGNVDGLWFYDASIARDQLWFKRSGNDLAISIIGTADKVTVKGWYSSPANQIEEIWTLDHEVLTNDKVEALVTAMATLTPPPAGQINLTTAQHNQLDSVIAASWS